MAGASARAACPDGLVKVIRSPVKNKVATGVGIGSSRPLDFAHGYHKALFASFGNT